MAKTSSLDGDFPLPLVTGRSPSGSSARESAQNLERRHDSSLSPHPTRQPVPRHNLLTSQLGELSKTLAFSDDAILALGASPAPHYVSPSSHGSKALFSHHTMGIAISGKKRQSKVGRHNSRGPGSRHLPCHLTQSLPHEAEHVGSTDPAPTHKGSPHRQPETETAKETASAQRAKTFSSQLESGAKPLHLRGKNSTIQLNNDTVFKKVLQPRYPQPPSSYQKVEKEAEKTVPVPVLYLQGHRRWLDLPQYIEVSSKSSHCLVALCKVHRAAICGHALGVPEHWECATPAQHTLSQPSLLLHHRAAPTARVLRHQ